MLFESSCTGFLAFLFPRRSRCFAAVIANISNLPAGCTAAPRSSSKVPAASATNKPPAHIAIIVLSTIDPRRRLFDDVDFDCHRAVSRSAEVSAFALEVACLRWVQRYFALLALLDLCIDV